MTNGQESVVWPASEHLVSIWKKKIGRRIQKSNDRYWERIAPGFYQPVCVGLPSSIERAYFQRPALGWRIALFATDAQYSNGSIPAYVRRDIVGFSLDDLPTARRRNAVRKGLNSAKFRLLSDPAILLEQGYSILVSTLLRTRHLPVPSLRQYRTEVEALFDKWHLVIAAFLDKEMLAGYIDGYSVDGTGYCENIVIAPRARSLCIGSALLFQLMQALGTSGHTTRMINGLHSQEKHSLDFFKKDFGFEVVQLPSLVHLSWPADAILSQLSPNKFYRFTGSNLKT
jgi:hypothetical protein